MDNPLMRIIYKRDMTEKQEVSQDIRYISLVASQISFGSIGSLNKIKKVTQPKTQNRFAHALWSKPALLNFKQARWNVSNQYELTLPITALSLAMLLKMDQEVVLYTDTHGEVLLGDLGYHRVYNIFDNFAAHTDFWAAGKIEALRHEPLDSTMIDTDIFIYDGDIIDRINSLNVCGSHTEDTTAYKDMLTFVQQIIPRFAGDNDTSTNCGFIKIDDVSKKDKFIMSYWDGAKRFDPDLLNKIKTAGNGAYCVDLAVEQFNFHKLCAPEHVITLPQNQTETEGLVHLVSFEKYLKIPMILDLLKLEYPEMYGKVIQKWNELGFSVQVEDEVYC